MKAVSKTVGELRHPRFREIADTWSGLHDGSMFSLVVPDWGDIAVHFVGDFTQLLFRLP